MDLSIALELQSYVKKPTINRINGKYPNIYNKFNLYSLFSFTITFKGATLLGKQRIIKLVTLLNLLNYR